MEYIPAKTIISNYASNNEWFGTNFNMNIYKGCCHGCIYCDSRSDCYQINDFDTVKAKENALELIDAFGFGTAIATKSPLITRDIDILKDIKEHSPVLCKVTITTTDDKLCRIIEPNVAPASKRFEAIHQLSKAGLFAGVLLMPVLPYINDTEENILSIVRQTANSGGKFIYGYGLFLLRNVKNTVFCIV